MSVATIHLRARALLELDHRIAAFETYRLALACTAGRSLELLKARLAAIAPPSQGA